jgi:hypothetical protein
MPEARAIPWFDTAHFPARLPERVDVLDSRASVEQNHLLVTLHIAALAELSQSRKTRRTFGRNEQALARADFSNRREQILICDCDRGAT